MQLSYGDHVKGKKDQFRGIIIREPFDMYGFTCVDILVNESGKCRIFTVQTNSIRKIRPPKRIRDLKKVVKDDLSLST